METYPDDPTFLSSRREAAAILVLWLATMVWTIGYCYANGYREHARESGEVSSLVPDLSDRQRTVDDLSTPLGLGIPDWVLWGVIAPWLLASVVTVWMCFGFLEDDPESLPSEGAGA